MHAMCTRGLWFLAALLSACGPKQAATPVPEATPFVPQLVSLPERLPVETFIVGASSVPARLKATQLELDFRSNIANATYECRTNQSEAFGPCGSHFSFGRLVAGMSYALWVRAVAPDGRKSRVPANLAFVADPLNGAPQASGAPKKVPTLKQLPGIEANPDAETASPSGSSSVLLDRQLQVGSFFAVAVPYDMQVQSYSTTKDYTGQLALFNRIGTFAESACHQAWDNIDTDASGARFCVSTPSRQALLADYPNPLPFNHVELVSGGVTPDEKLFVAAFDDDTDPLETGVGINITCQGARARGVAALPPLHDFYPATRADGLGGQVLDWCQTTGADGWWWVGYYAARLGTKPNAPRIKVIYAASAARGIITSAQFIAQAASFLPSTLVAIARPTP